MINALKTAFAGFAFFALAGAATASETTVTASPTVASSATSVTLEKGLYYQDIKIGAGEPITSSSIIKVHYRGRLLNGTLFDGSREKAIPIPLRARLGQAEVVEGMDRGLQGMRLGGVRRIEMPPELAYGKRGSGRIPPDATLVFEVELVEIESFAP